RAGASPAASRRRVQKSRRACPPGTQVGARVWLPRPLPAPARLPWQEPQRDAWSPLPRPGEAAPLDRFFRPGSWRNAPAIRTPTEPYSPAVLAAARHAGPPANTKPHVAWEPHTPPGVCRQAPLPALRPDFVAPPGGPQGWLLLRPARCDGRES